MDSFFQIEPQTKQYCLWNYRFDGYTCFPLKHDRTNSEVNEAGIPGSPGVTNAALEERWTEYTDQSSEQTVLTGI